MSNHGNKPLEEEFRSSQIYKTLTGSGIPAADKIAQGLNKAAEGIDKALNGVAPPVKRSQSRGYYQRYTQGPGNSQTPSGSSGSAPGRNPAQGNDPHSYSYQYSYQSGQPGGRRTTQTVGTQTVGTQTVGTQTTRPGQRPAWGNPAPAQTTGAQTAGTQTAGAQPGRKPVGVSPAPAQVAGAQTAGAQPGRKPAGVSPAPAPQMKVVRKGSPMKFYLTGAAALIYALNFPLYEPSHFIVFGLVLVGVFLLSSKLFRGKKEFVPVEPVKPREEPRKKEEKPKEEPAKTTGNPEVDKLIADGNQYLKKLRAANDAIPEETLSEDIDRMEKAAADIFRYIGDHPEKAPQIRKFMNYYLPTTLKLLNSYQRLSSQSVKGENITSTMFNIAGMMHTVADAFEKQLDSLFTDEAMDISADISVFETLLKQEGFVEEKKETKP